MQVLNVGDCGFVTGGRVDIGGSGTRGPNPAVGIKGDTRKARKVVIAAAAATPSGLVARVAAAAVAAILTND